MRSLEKRLHRVRRVGAEPRHARWIITGTVGNGKTSELYHLGDSISAERMVVFVELWRHFEQTVRDPGALERLEPWELIGLLGLAVYRAGSDYGHREWADADVDFAKALEALQDPSQDGGATLDVAELGRGMIVAASGFAGAALGGPASAAAAAGVGRVAAEAGLSLAKTAAEATKWSWPIGLRNRKPRQDQEPEIRALVQAVNRLLMSLQQSYTRPLTLIIDGPDRISDVQRLETLFVDSSLLSELVCDVITTGPELMLHGLSQRVRDFRTIELCNVPVLDRQHPERPGEGIEFFRELVDKRVAAVARESRPDNELVATAPFPDAVTERLAYYSGGVVRDFVRMTQATVGEAWEANVPALTLAMVDEALNEFRAWKHSRMTKGEIALLRGVMDDPEHGLPSDKAAFELLRQQRLLPYPNENPWYYPHPLLTMSLLKPTSSPGSES